MPKVEDSHAMSSNFEVVVLISGRGSNLENLVRKMSNYKISAVISNNPAAAGLEFARHNGIDTFSFGRDCFQTVKEQKEAIFQKVEQLKPNLIALAGFMMIVPPSVAEKTFGRMINIHPSLLPDLPGLDTHARAIAAGNSRHGCSVHFVDSGVDTGPIIAQAELQCLKGETPEGLGERVLALEHRLYPWVVKNIAAGGIVLSNRSVRIRGDVVESAKAEGFILPTS